MAEVHERVDAVLKCECSEVIVKSRGDEEVVRAKVLIIKGENVYAVCKKCNAEVQLPLKKSNDGSVDLGPKLWLNG